LVAPAGDAKVALKNPLPITFTAEPQPLTKDDTQAGVASVGLKINGVDIATAPVMGSPNTYAATADFNTFITKPSGTTTLSLTATNARTPAPVQSNINPTVFVDDAGPIINITTPTQNQLVGGIVTMTFTVTDAGSGVDANSVQVSVYDQVHKLGEPAGAWNQQGDTYTYKFDARLIADTVAQINVSVSAQDTVQNIGSSKSIPIYIDTVKPQVDIDPSAIRVNTNGQCTGAFDPVGPVAISDLAANLTRAEFIRVMVWDRTNQVPNSKAILHFAGTDPTSVWVYVHNPSDSSYLLVNKLDPGGTCNEIGDTSQPRSMTALTPGGVPWNTGDAASTPVPGNVCVAAPDGGQPSHLCTNNASDMWQVIGHYEGDLTEPAIYAYAVTAGTKECTGSALDFGDAIDANGWVCFAAQAIDKVGNVGVSPPVRLCVDKDPTDKVTPPCADPMAVPPTCTDGCTPPVRGGGTIVAAN
jgi:hypothetical protein